MVAGFIEVYKRPMRLPGLAVLLLFAHAALAQTCPFDAKVRGLAEDHAALAALSNELQGRFKPSLAATRKSCRRVETDVRVVRTLDGLSRRCAAALVELTIDADDCRDATIINGAPDFSPGSFAVVSPDAKGRLVIERVFEGRPPFGPLPAPEVLHGECGSALGVGGPGGLLAVAREPSLRFDGCVMRGVPEALVRSLVTAALEKSESPAVTCRFFEGDARAPLCAVTTGTTDAGVAVVSSGGFVPAFEAGDLPHFEPGGAYLELTDGGAQWLCNHLRFEPGSPLALPAAARPGCTPPVAKQALLRRAFDEATPRAVDGAWRHDVALEPTSTPLRVERLVLDSGRGLLNEAQLATRLREGVEAYTRCASDWGRLDGATGTLVTALSEVRLGLDDRALADEPCLATLRDALHAFSPRYARHASTSVFRFRLGRARR